ncbi:hypothetical protein [Pseudomonas syringae]|uniref:ATPase n=1 Tax=Pseudomonas syringae TaxID=317 RepID=A0A085VD20_PSESX|nr:hypothetical protein [Pseudomonas syringae]KFE53333.1 ATPase [Pseudomonas syringae]
MKANKSITRAFCVELQQELSIAAARREYFSMETPQRFEFLCSTEACRKLGAKVTGVRYDVKPQDNPTFVSAHFRANPHYNHHPDCEWIEDSDDENQTPSDIEETEPQARLRKAKRKLDDYIDVFDPGIKAPAKEQSKDRAFKPVSLPVTDDTLPAEPAQLKTAHKRETRTNNLERLVDSFRQAKAQLSTDDFKLLTLKVPGQGELALRSYFRHIKYAQPGHNNRVLYGGGLVERYGSGFKFKFFDRLEGKPVTLYVSPAQMKAYRSSRYISELLSHAEEVRFFTVYALGEVSQSPSGKSVSVAVEDLRHLVIVLGPAKE